MLHVLWRGEADRALLAGGIQLPLWPVDGAAGLWEMSARVRRLDEAVIALMVGVIEPGGTMLGQPAGEPAVYRGPDAPAPDPAGAPGGRAQRVHPRPGAATAGGLAQP